MNQTVAAAPRLPGPLPLPPLCTIPRCISKRYCPPQKMLVRCCCPCVCACLLWHAALQDGGVVSLFLHSSSDEHKDDALTRRRTRRRTTTTSSSNNSQELSCCFRPPKKLCIGFLDLHKPLVLGPAVLSIRCVRTCVRRVPLLFFPL